MTEGELTSGSIVKLTEQHDYSNGWFRSGISLSNGTEGRVVELVDSDNVNVVFGR